ncbi:MAG: ABC transporter substrate-binding protein, partial [Thermoleophilaceae bacterium]
MRIAFGTYPARATALALAAAALVAGCGSTKKEDLAHGSTLTIYTSLPRHGVSARDADAVAAGERLALADAGGRAGGRRLRLVELDDSAPGKGTTWDGSTVEENAKRAAKDPSTIAYIGELDFGGSAISVPVTNAKGILQVSPGDGLTSLTQLQPGGFKTGPERYYPKGFRTFLRLVPTDLRQVDQLIGWIRSRGDRRLAIVHDDRVFGREMAVQAMAAAGSHDVSVVRVTEAPDAGSYAGVVRKLASKDPDAVAYLGVGDPPTADLLRRLASAMPGVPLYGSSGLAVDPAALKGAPDVDLLDATLPASSYGRDGERVLERLRRQVGGPVPVAALYGYEAMRVVLDAMDRAGRRSADRDAVARAALVPRTRHSVIGTYSLSRSGDVAPVRFAAYRLDDGEDRLVPYPQ